MWIFTKNGFLSIVQHRDRPDVLLVRSRFAGDIQDIFGDEHTSGYKVETNPTADYMYRAELPKVKVAEVIANQVTDIDYPNFKDYIMLNRGGEYLGVCFAVYHAILETVLGYQVMRVGNTKKKYKWFK